MRNGMEGGRDYVRALGGVKGGKRGTGDRRGTEDGRETGDGDGERDGNEERDGTEGEVRTNRTCSAALRHFSVATSCVVP